MSPGPAVIWAPSEPPFGGNTHVTNNVPLKANKLGLELIYM